MDRYLTPNGLKKIQDQLAQLKQKRIEISRRIEEAKALGDLSENADYIKAKEEQSFNEGKIRELENLLATAEVVAQKPSSNHKVGLGSTVVVQSNGNTYQYTIVGAGESDPEKGKISNESPLGEQFMGKRVGDTFEVMTPSGKKIFKIIEIK